MRILAGFGEFQARARVQLLEGLHSVVFANAQHVMDARDPGEYFSKESPNIYDLLLYRTQ